jgi:hypothetical protein
MGRYCLEDVNIDREVLKYVLNKLDVRTYTKADLAQCKEKRRSVLKMAMNLRVP